MSPHTYTVAGTVAPQYKFSGFPGFLSWTIQSSETHSIRPEDRFIFHPFKSIESVPQPNHWTNFDIFILYESLGRLDTSSMVTCCPPPSLFESLSPLQATIHRVTSTATGC
ncbi:hypothetical protein AVEN_160811-1 [Araneus ventricosus]|uniref:Uncharacterized protein n=1 Tax=Araneus ventricosus TaxID=182803 RepID=A0A4Y2J049_ARAVE|nr:hypothetical protein AVEN_160811-1 [Araneus ventricosus]